MRALAALLVVGLASGCAAPTDEPNEDDEANPAAEIDHPAGKETDEGGEVHVTSNPINPGSGGCTNWIEWKRITASYIDVRYRTSCRDTNFLLTAQGYTTRDGAWLCSRTSSVRGRGSASTAWCRLWDPSGNQYWSFVSEGSKNASDSIPPYGVNMRF